MKVMETYIVKTATNQMTTLYRCEGDQWILTSQVQTDSAIFGLAGTYFDPINAVEAQKLISKTKEA